MQRVQKVKEKVRERKSCKRKREGEKRGENSFAIVREAISFRRDAREDQLYTAVFISKKDIYS